MEPDKPESQSTGPKIKEMIASAPDIISELMCEFIEKKDLNARVKIRMRMKALLDIIAVDTIYPKTAATTPGGGFARRRRAGFGMGGPMPIGEPILGEAVQDRIEDGILGDVQPVPGAEPIGDDLG